MSTHNLMTTFRIILEDVPDISAIVILEDDERVARFFHGKAHMEDLTMEFTIAKMLVTGLLADKHDLVKFTNKELECLSEFFKVYADRVIHEGRKEQKNVSLKA